jgi:hypothetical protein
VRIIRWRRPSSPIARRAALTRLVNTESPTNRLPQTLSSSSSLGTHPPAFAQEQRQHVEHLRLHRLDDSGSPKFVPTDVQLAVAEDVGHCAPRRF